jgi:hypothetical protein
MGKRVCTAVLAGVVLEPVQRSEATYRTVMLVTLDMEQTLLAEVTDQAWS